MTDTERQFSLNEPESPFVSVVREIAEEKETKPHNLDPPLYEIIPPDSLDRLVTKTDSEVEVMFRYKDLQLTIRSGKEKSVVEPIDTQ